MGKLIAVILFISVYSIASAVELVQVSWDTKNAAPVAKLDKVNKPFLSLARAGIAAVPEPLLMQLTFLGGSALGLPDSKAKELHELFAERYRIIAADPVFKSAPTALPYCYAEKKQERGFATVYVPDKADSSSRVILFLHGYGGSFLLYQHFFSRIFPDYIIICPAFGISCAFISGAYLKECLNAVSEKLGFRLRKPLLIGLSAGGFGGFREYARNKDSYIAYICLAAYPPQDTWSFLPRNGHLRVLAGEKEVFVGNGDFARAEKQIKPKVKDYSSYLIPGETHFFMLSSESETCRMLEGWAKAFAEH